MTYREVKFNLFELEDKYYLGHCISADCQEDSRAMGLGIVVEFNKRFKVKSKIQNHPKVKVGDCVLIDRTFNLITKSKYYGKPSYETMRTSLESMKDIIIENDIKYIGLPKIGSGLDRLVWVAVREIIKDVFKDLDVEIVVCYL